MKTRIISVVLLIIAVAFCLPNVTSVAADSLIAEHSKSAVLMNFDTGEVLYEQNADERLPIASMVKIMTLNLVFDAIKDGRLHYNDMVSISENAAGMGGSQAFLDAGSHYKAEELIKSIIVASANDSCVALAEHLCGSVSVFVEEMNKKAKELSMNNTNYANCTGLPAENCYSTARDASVAMKELASHKDYFKFSKVWMYDIQHKNGRITQLTNTNRLSRFYDGCDGGKTGYTNAAGHCLSATAIRNGMRLISTVVCGADSKSRFSDVAAMLNYGFANYESKIMAKADTVAGEVKCRGGVEERVTAVLENDLRLTGKRGQISADVVYLMDEYVKAPVNQGQRVGKAVLVDKAGKELASVNLIAAASIKEANLWDIIKKLFTA